MEPEAEVRAIKSFVLRSGRMSSAQKRSYEILFPLYAIKGDDKEIFDCHCFFGNRAPLVIEIGFGMGRATADIAYKNPEINYLGIEVHKPGIGRLLWEIEKLRLKNIRIIEGDAVDILMDKIRDNSVSAFHIFFPDPWPKKRHYKRRLVKRPFTDMLARKLVSGGYVYMVSDWVDYAEWALEELSATEGLLNRYAAFSEPQQWRPETEFEKKGRFKNHEIKELFFIKR
jgi:tRNA (guanine-N7-)-methyltransferase